MAAYSKRHGQTYNAPPVTKSDDWPRQTASTEDGIAEEIVGIICNLYEGCVELSELTEALGVTKSREYFGEARPEVFFSRYHHLFEVQRHGSGLNNWRVRVKNCITLCDAYHRKGGCPSPQSCNKLHICKLFILGTCIYGSQTSSHSRRCRSSHSFQSDPHNHIILRKNKLYEFSEESLKILLKRSCPDCFRPDICRFYNTSTGCNKNACLSLHICRSYITAHCRYGDMCTFSHRIYEPQPKMVLEKYGIDTSQKPSEILHKLRFMMTEGTCVKQGAIYKSRDKPTSRSHSGGSTAVKQPYRPKRSPSPSHRPKSPIHASVTPRSASPQRDTAVSTKEPTENNKTTICLHNLYGNCNYGDQCVKHHIMMPYMWQKYKSADVWLNFTDERNMSTEKKFCDPRIEKYERVSKGQKSKLFDFNKMVIIDSRIGKVCHIRRLSTVSYVEMSSNEKLSTQWLWYWGDENCEWHEYGSERGIDVVSSAMIESVYQGFLKKRSEKYYKLTCDNQTSRIQFDGMYEYSEKTVACKSVRRRPKYISQDTVNKILKQSVLQSVTSSGTVLSLVNPPMGKDNIPQHWNKAAKSADGYKMVMLSEGGYTADEYRQVSEMFQKTMPCDLIISIERVQNIELWRNFTRKYDAMQKWQTRGEVQTQHLFHGTSEKLLNIICRDNFNWRLSGKITGSKFGKGIYLGTTAKYADSFAESDNLYRKIFLSRVLVGDFVQGDPSYNLPPPRDESDPFGNLYDACVNNELNPCIFVIFDKSQIYPEYVITYMRYDDIH